MLNSIAALFGRGPSNRSSSTVGSSSFGVGSSGHPYSANSHGFNNDSYIESEGAGAGLGAAYPPRGPADGLGSAELSTSHGRSPLHGQAPQNLPPPRVRHSMARVRQLMKRINPELLDTLSYPAPSKLINQLQATINTYSRGSGPLTLPHDFVECYTLHDGQDTFSVPRNGENEEIEGATGFIYGLWWMSIEEIIEEYQFWRRLDISTPPSPVVSRTRPSGPSAAEKGKGKETRHASHARAPSQDAFLFGSEMDPRTIRGRMRSCPEGYVREEYSHPSWLPILKDGYGNYIGIDLDPPSAPTPTSPRTGSAGMPNILPSRGQVIAFGREIDTKIVLYNGWCDTGTGGEGGVGGWARFLAAYADDLATSSALASSRSNPSASGGHGHFSSDHSYAAHRFEEDDEAVYRATFSGRSDNATSLNAARAAQGLEWMNSNPLYSELGAIEAIVERSKRFWANLGMYDLDGEILLDYGNHQHQRQSPETPTANRTFVNHSSPDRSRPAPLNIPASDPGDKALLTRAPGAADASDDHSADAQLENEGNRATAAHQEPGPASPDLTDIVSPAPTSSSTMSETAQLRPSVGASPIELEEPEAEFVDVDPASSTTALVRPREHENPPLLPMSPEPSLVLSPPSPKTIHAGFLHHLPPTSPNRGDLNNGGLQSPARVSPGQAERYAERADRERKAFMESNGEFVHGSGRTPTALRDPTVRRQPRKPLPPPMPLNLPTLEFGNGIWEHHDHDMSGDFDDKGFEVIVDRR